MARIETKEYTLEYKDDEATKQAVFEKVLDFFVRMNSFSGEGIAQLDKPQIESPIFLGDLADDVFCFDLHYKDE